METETMEPKWLELARGQLGTKRIPGKGSNRKVLDYFAEAGHPEIKDDDVAYCAAFAGAMLKRAGLPNSGSLAARSYLNYGTKLDEPREGCICVFSRGNNSWEGHVAFYLGETSSTIKILGGNQGGGAVTISSYAKSKLLGYRWPVEPTVAALREAGSSEINIAESLQTGAKVMGATAVVVEGADKSGAMEQLKDASDGLGVIQHAMEGLNALVKFASANFAVVAIIGCVAVVFLSRKWIKQRIARHLAGHPIFGGK